MPHFFLKFYNINGKKTFLKRCLFVGQILTSIGGRSSAVVCAISIHPGSYPECRGPIVGLESSGVVFTIKLGTLRDETDGFYKNKVKNRG